MFHPVGQILFPPRSQFPHLNKLMFCWVKTGQHAWPSPPMVPPPPPPHANPGLWPPLASDSPAEKNSLGLSLFKPDFPDICAPSPFFKSKTNEFLMSWCWERHRQPPPPPQQTLDETLGPLWPQPCPGNSFSFRLVREPPY